MYQILGGKTDIFDTPKCDQSIGLISECKHHHEPRFLSSDNKQDKPICQVNIWSMGIIDGEARQFNPQKYRYILCVQVAMSVSEDKTYVLNEHFYESSGHLFDHCI